MSTQEKPNGIGDIVAKCWKDAAFKKRFMSDPASVLREHHIEVQAEIQLKVVENTDKVVYITLPPAPSSVELSNSELAAAAGGRAASVSRHVLAGHDCVKYTYWGDAQCSLH